jgi:hypothetical protein
LRQPCYLDHGKHLGESAWRDYGTTRGVCQMNQGNSMISLILILVPPPRKEYNQN